GTIGAIGVSESNPDIVYVGTGEFPIRGNVSHGDGVWKSTDGGKTLTLLGLAETQQIARVRVHPTNPDIVYVAAQGHAFGPNPERGVYKSIDGGKTWNKVLFRNDSTGAADLILDPTNPNVLYAGLWQAQRRPWTLVSGGVGSGLFKSTDAGEHWTELTKNPGLPTGLWGNIGIAVSPAKPARVWALIEADSGGVYRSDDSGSTWKYLNSDHKLRERAWYYSKIFADPKDTNTVWAPEVNLFKSTDGGVTFRHVIDPHGDNHDLWIASNDANRMIEGNDGGANVSFNGGKTWTDQDVATAQFYHVETTNHFPYRVCGAQQDNSGVCGPSRWPGGIDRGQWYDVSGESGYIQARPDNPDITYGGDNSGFLGRVDHKTGFFRLINPWPDSPDGHAAAEGRYRFQWTAPLLISPHDPNTLYIGANVLFKSNDEGQSWTAISPDLSRHDPKTLGPSGGPITLDQTTAEYYATIFAIAESPLRRGQLWVGSDDGLIHLTRDGGLTWTDVTPKELPPWSRISIIEGDLVAATHGRSFWILDDITPLRQMSPATTLTDVQLFRPRDAYRVDWGGGFGGGGSDAHPVGKNPPSGAVIDYWLKSAGQTVTIEILDSAGHLIRSFSSVQDSLTRVDSLHTDSLKRARTDSLKKAGIADSAKIDSILGTLPGGDVKEEDKPWPHRPSAAPRAANKVGLNQFVWNMRTEPVTEFWGMSDIATEGPMSLPGL